MCPTLVASRIGGKAEWRNRFIALRNVGALSNILKRFIGAPASIRKDTPLSLSLWANNSPLLLTPGNKVPVQEMNRGNLGNFSLSSAPETGIPRQPFHAHILLRNQIHTCLPNCSNFLIFHSYELSVTTTTRIVRDKSTIINDNHVDIFDESKEGRTHLAFFSRGSRFKSCHVTWKSCASG